MALSEPGGYRQLLQLVGHEYLHHGMFVVSDRLNTVYDYDRAVISEGLWFAEGITSYFDLTTTLWQGAVIAPRCLLISGENSPGS